MEIKVVRQILEWNEDCHKEVQEELNENNVKMIILWDLQELEKQLLY